MSDGQKLHGLDHLRALAIIMVFMFHYGRLFPHPEWTNTISKFGWTGVDLFFVLSGFLISSQLFTTIAGAGRVPVFNFYLKRFFRIIPAYLAVVALYFTLPVVREREALAPLWRYLSFTQNYGLDVHEHGTFSHAWSLCIEEQFYFVLPLMLAAFLATGMFRKSYRLLPALLIAGMAGRYFSYMHFIAPYILTSDGWRLYWYEWIYYPTHCRLDGLLAGITVGALWVYQPRLMERIRPYGNTLLLAGILVLSAAYLVCVDETSLAASVAGFPLVATGYGILVLGAVTPSSLLYKYKWRASSTIAVLSYAMYLLHKMIIHLVQLVCDTDAMPADGNMVFVLCGAATVVAALLLNMVVERPFLKLRSRILPAPKAS